MIKHMKQTTKYDDIIHLPHHVSSSRPQMPITDRAAQFSPFAALTGHGAAIKETARLTDQRIELDESVKRRLDEQFLIIMKQMPQQPLLNITYFLPDDKKDGGSYVQLEDRVKKIDSYRRRMFMMNGTEVPIEDIIEIEIKEIEEK